MVNLASVCLAYLSSEFPAKIEEVRHLARRVVPEAFINVDRNGQEAVGSLSSHFFDIHPSVRAGDEHWPVVLSMAVEIKGNVTTVLMASKIFYLSLFLS